MKSYYINHQNQKDGAHEVHTADCPFLPGSIDRRYIGAYKSVDMALDSARVEYMDVNCCSYCCKSEADAAIA
ncbi:hypothetical protein K4L44_09025 [Halosquirtibacter laminarini]|uniref:Uncharacterized protein n=1 Tax=Halosquirtibacter laminarini TaxID=3374600 RepID=A0AC61NBA1_9BACT|nr:hypothetical protein K4L44_09025 [Prolixibacteraceae bacterium]